MQTAPKPDALNRKVTPAGIPVNIAMIMLDSTSTANFIRKMPLTKAYLKTRPTVFMKGNTIVGDGTVAQLSAILTGIAEVDQPEARRSKPNATVVDDWRWVWRDYQQHGYVTLYTEDTPSYGAFNYRLLGFENPPTDHYGRYFWMEVEQLYNDNSLRTRDGLIPRFLKVISFLFSFFFGRANSESNRHLCTGNQAMHRLTMNYYLSFLRTYPNKPKFSFLNFHGISHDDINTVGYADEDLAHLLKTMEKESYLNDTIVFLFGDHGSRFGSMRKTLQGKLEERLPHLSITFPTWFPKKYPELYKTIQLNSELLTTPFDTYATMQHILSYPHLPKGIKIGQSLLKPIDPETRDCLSVGVEDHWCPCMNFESISVTNYIVTTAVEFSVAYINKLLEEESTVQKLCHKLNLKQIKTALQQMPNERLQKFDKTFADHRCDSCGVNIGEKSQNTLTHDTLYQIQFVTSPNDGFYEASIQFHKGQPSIKGTISRVDAYGHQADCIKATYVHLLKYCYCK